VITQTVTLIRRTKGVPDAFGNDTWTTAATPVQAVYAPGSSSENVGQGRDALTLQPTVYLPGGTDVRAVDAVVIDGDTFEVDGEPIDWRHALTGWNPGVEVRLRRVTG
jgi:endonuclease YncB( thermonuclease family)